MNTCRSIDGYTCNSEGICMTRHNKTIDQVFDLKGMELRWLRHQSNFTYLNNSLFFLLFGSLNDSPLERKVSSIKKKGLSEWLFIRAWLGCIKTSTQSRQTHKATAYLHMHTFTDPDTSRDSFPFSEGTTQLLPLMALFHFNKGAVILKWHPCAI